MTNRALLVGIDVYPDPRNNLNSCVADTLAVKQTLQSMLGFEAGSIELLHNRDATLARVSAGLDTMFSGVQSGDRLVYFQSSHGWRYPEGNTMVEVICLYDKFLKDTDLVAKTQNLPPGVLTVICDCCHAGGLNKVFFPGGDAVEVARAKVWQPPREEEERSAELYSQVTQFKFFGRAPTGDAAAVAKNFEIIPQGIAPQKDVGAGAANLNGVIFAACQADQTAAAGTRATDNLSAFTFALIKELDTSISLSELRNRVVRRLGNLNMSQVPEALAPPQLQQLLTQAFVSGQASAPSPTVTPTATPTPTPGDETFDPYNFLRETINGLFSTVR